MGPSDRGGALPPHLKEYFEKDPLLNIELSESLRHGHGQVIASGSEGLLIRHGVGGLSMASAVSLDYGRFLVSFLPADIPVMHVCQEWLADMAMAKCGFEGKMTCHKVVYLKKTPIRYQARLEIRQTRPDEAAQIIAHYDLHEPDDIRRTIREGRLWSGCLGGHLIGFIGLHEEGSMGLLHIVEPYRRRGFAEELEGFLVNHLLAQGEVPRGDVITGNEASRSLQKKLGFTEASGLVYWIFPSEA